MWPSPYPWLEKELGDETAYFAVKRDPSAAQRGG